MRRGEIWWADMPPPWGSRPVLLLSRDEAYDLLTRVVIVPLTTRLRRVPSAVLLTPDTDGLPAPSVVSLDNIQAIPKERLVSMVSGLSDRRMLEVEAALHFALGLCT